MSRDENSDGAPIDEPRRSGGLGSLLPAIALTGAAGYAIQIAVPLWADEAQSYVTFSVFWAALYIVVNGLSGVQQEVARASRPLSAGKGYPVLARYVLIGTLVVALVTGVASWFMAQSLFHEDGAALSGLFILGSASYVGLAALGGVLFGSRRNGQIMLFLTLDTVLRLVLMLLVMAVSDSPVLLAVAVVLPFALSAGTLLVVARRTLPAITLDVNLLQLLRNSSQTVVASVAMGCIISGLPLFLALSAASAPVGTAASTILLATLVRAPLVIPLMALQSFFVVRFRDSTNVGRAVSLYTAGLLGLALVLSAIAAWVGPALFELLFTSYEPVSAALVFGLVLSAGFMGVLFVTGAGVLARGGHSFYVLGWIAAAVAVVALLLAPLGLTFEVSVVLALFAGPIVGGICHVGGMLVMIRRHRRVA